MADVLDLEMAATMPWTVAEGGTLWIASGKCRDGGGFEDCLLRCVLLYGEVKFIGTDAIERAREVFLVHAAEPLTAVEEDDQATIDYAVRDRGGES